MTHSVPSRRSSDLDTLKGAPVRIRLQGEEDYSRTGTIDFVDNALSTGSGTIGVRAIISNVDGKLRPGMFGQLHLAASATQPSVVVPDTASVHDGAPCVVYVIGQRGGVHGRAGAPV